MTAPTAHPPTPPAAAAPADLVVRGGVIRTLSDPAPLTEALAVRAGRVIALGADAAALADGATRVLELDGRTVIPGINDAHLHGAWLGARWPHFFFGDHAGSHQSTGRLVDGEDGRRAALRRTWGILAALGITSYTEPGIGPGEDDGETGCFGSAMLDTYVALHAERRQTVRITLLRLFGALDGESTLEDFERGIRRPPPATDPRWLAIPGVKVFADGIPPLRTAWVREPYPDGSTGSPLTRGPGSRPAALRAMVEIAHLRGEQIAVHATGDRAIAEFLDALEAVGARPDLAHPHYVVHADLVAPDLIARMRRQGVGVSMQPLIAAHTHDWARSEIGEERARRAWPLAATLDAGVVTTLSSDAPIATPDWRPSLDAAAGILAAAGRPHDSALREQLLRHVTVTPARQDGAAHWKGTLAIGMAADMCVLDADPVPPGRDFADLSVEATIVDGRVVFDRADAPAHDAALSER